MMVMGKKGNKHIPREFLTHERNPINPGDEDRKVKLDKKFDAKHEIDEDTHDKDNIRFKNYLDYETKRGNVVHKVDGGFKIEYKKKGVTTGEKFVHKDGVKKTTLAEHKKKTPPVANNAHYRKMTKKLNTDIVRHDSLSYTTYTISDLVDPATITVAQSYFYQPLVSYIDRRPSGDYTLVFVYPKRSSPDTSVFNMETNPNYLLEVDKKVIPDHHFHNKLPGATTRIMLDSTRWRQKLSK